MLPPHVTTEATRSTETAAFRILLIQSESTPRKTLRVALERAGTSVVAVDSAAVGIVRLKWNHYSLVIFSGRPGRTPLLEDFEMLVERGKPVARDDGYELYAPAHGLLAEAVLVLPFTDAARVTASMEAVRQRVIELAAQKA